jgi:Xaa-Pro aminopeptidase
MQPGDVVLVDAGAEVGRYTADVTRTYRLPGGEDGFFRSLHALVQSVERNAIDRCRPGAEWRDIHLAAAREISEGLVALGLLVGAPDSLLERDTPALFFPHGIGHMVGLGVRDASGYLPGRTRSDRPGLNMLRTDLPLEAGYVMTVEPGIYFIPALLQDPALRERHRDAVRWDRVDALMTFGGIRIEDDVLVTTSDPEVLTSAIP